MPQKHSETPIFDLIVINILFIVDSLPKNILSLFKIKLTNQLILSNTITKSIYNSKSNRKLFVERSTNCL